MKEQGEPPWRPGTQNREEHLRDSSAPTDNSSSRGKGPGTRRSGVRGWLCDHRQVTSLFWLEFLHVIKGGVS